MIQGPEIEVQLCLYPVDPFDISRGIILRQQFHTGADVNKIAKINYTTLHPPRSSLDECRITSVPLVIILTLQREPEIQWAYEMTLRGALGGIQGW